MTFNHVTLSECPTACVVGCRFVCHEAHHTRRLHDPAVCVRVQRALRREPTRPGRVR